MTPGFEFEQEIWKRGLIVAGVDEVGRGAFAGPLVAGAVAFAPQILNPKFETLKIRIDDSKKLSRIQRERASVWIKNNALAWAVGEVEVWEINNLGMGKALKIAYERALGNLEVKADEVLLDGLGGIIRGDSISFSIAAASIVAKVHRDKILCDAAQNTKYSAYLWYKNMGYGTREHREAIIKYGMTDYHRKQFVETFLRRLIPGSDFCLL